MADVRAWTAELNSGCAVTEERYCSTEAITRVGSAADVRVGRRLAAAGLGRAASVVVVWALARRVSVERMSVLAKSMVVVCLRYLSVGKCNASVRMSDSDVSNGGYRDGEG